MTIWRGPLLLMLLAVALLSLAAAYVFGRAVPVSEQWPLFEALRTTASIIFAVVGAWLAIIYPDRLKFSFRGGDAPRGNGAKFTALMTPVVHSTAILAAILVIGVAAPILRRVPFLLEHVEVCRGVAYVLLTALTEWQLVTVLLTLFPAHLIKASADEEEDKKAIHEAYRA